MNVQNQLNSNEKIEEHCLRTKEEILDKIHYCIRRMYAENDTSKFRFFEGNLYALLWVLKQ